jgi:lysophospholipase L1-like esterase
VGARSALVRLTAIALGLVLAGVIGEGAVRVYARLDESAGRMFLGSDPLAVMIEPHGVLGYRPRPNAIFHYRDGTIATANAMSYRGPVVKTPKPAGTFRIVLLGGSTTHGWGVADDETIDAHMRRLAKDRYPARTVEVVNLAFDGYDSLQLLERLRTDGMRFEPDVIIVNAGINDVRNTRFPDLGDPDPRTLIWETVLERLRRERARGGPTAWTRIKHHVYLARLPEVVRHYMTVTRSGRAGVTPNLAAADIFERNLRRMAAEARQRQIPVIFSTPPSSLASRYAHDATSDISYWIVDAATTQRVRDELARRMRRAVAQEVAECHDVAYMSHQLSPEMFLDDAHLTSSGNRAMAHDFVDAIAPYLEGRRRAPCLRRDPRVAR